MDNRSNYTRLPTRILQDSSHEIDLPDFIPLAGASGSVGPRSARASEQECNRDMLEFGWFSQPRVCSAEKGRGVATNHQSESPKLLPQHSALQDGKYLYRQRYFERGRLYGQDRSQRRLFQCEDPSNPQEVFEISVERNYLPVQSSPLWLSHSPQSVLQDYAGSNKSPTGEGSTSSAVSRRHTGRSKLTQSTKGAHEIGSATPADFRFLTQRKEVRVRTYSGDRVPWLYGRFSPDEDFPSYTENEESNEGMSESYSSEECFSSQSSPPYWEDDIDNTRSPSSSSSLQISPATEEQDSVEKQAELLRDGNLGQRLQDGSHLVELSIAVAQRESDDHTTRQIDNGDRCINQRLGSILSGVESRRTLANSGKEPAHKHAGTEVSFPSSPDICGNKKQYAHSPTARQQNSNSIYKPKRGNTLQTSVGFGMQAVELVSQEGSDSTGRTHSGSGEHSSRLRVQSVPGPLRLDAVEDSVPKDKSKVGSNGCGPICSTAQPPDKKVLQLPSGSRSHGSGCFLAELESALPICVPTISASGKNTSEDPKRASSESGCDSSSVAKTTLVPSVAGNDDRSTDLSSTAEEPPSESTETNPSPPEGESSTLDRVAGVRNSLQEQGISQEAADIICSSWRKSTEKSYTSAWNKWSSWCQERSINPFSATIAQVADFLTCQFNSGKQYSTINSYRSAISNTHPQIEGQPVGKHLIICRLMQGMFNERPSEPRYSEIWDIDQVLSHLETMEDLDCLSFKELTLKTAMLMALANADRASDLHLLDIRYMQQQGDTVKFVVAGLSKTRRSGPPRQVEYASFVDKPKLCPVKALHAYIDQTKDKRAEKEYKLFLALKKPHLSVSTGTISRWLKEMLRMAGINNKFTAHSTRAASVSAAKAKGLTVREILNAGNWSRESTFNKFYNKEITLTTENAGCYTQTLFSIKEKKVSYL